MRLFALIFLVGCTTTSDADKDADNEATDTDGGTEGSEGTDDGTDGTDGTDDGTEDSDTSTGFVTPDEFFMADGEYVAVGVYYPEAGGTGDEYGNLEASDFGITGMVLDHTNLLATVTISAAEYEADIDGSEMTESSCSGGEISDEWEEERLYLESDPIALSDGKMWTPAVLTPWTLFPGVECPSGPREALYVFGSLANNDQFDLILEPK